MTVSPDPTAVPDIAALAKALQLLGSRPSDFFPPHTDDVTLTKAALATGVHARASKIAYKAQADVGHSGQAHELPALDGRVVHAIQQDDPRPQAGMLYWYGHTSEVARCLRTLRQANAESSTSDDVLSPLLSAAADTSRALMVLLETIINLGPDHLDRLTGNLAEGEEMLTSARANTAEASQRLRNPDAFN